jgi:spore germination protein GerM
MQIVVDIMFAWLLVFALSGCVGGSSGASPMAKTAVPPPSDAGQEDIASSVERPATVRLVFMGKGDSSTCIASHEVERHLPPGVDPATFVVTELLRGPTRDERARGLYSSFERSVADPKATPLRNHLRHVEITDMIAVVDFGFAGQSFLNQAACAATAVRSSIERTLLALPGVRVVQFSIEGQVVAEWDA